jgi:hypothetical protein
MGFVTNKYKKITPIKQIHTNSCWAACLQWWCRAANNNNALSQKVLMKEEDVKSRYEGDSVTGVVHAKDHADYGVLEEHELLWLLQQARWGMAAYKMSGFNGDSLSALLENGPVYIGYFDSFSNGNHVNVICGYDAELDMVEAMEPRKGKFVERGLHVYTSHSGMNLVGWKP